MPETKLLFPGLRSFYEFLDPLSWVLVRCSAGIILAVHGWGKLQRGPQELAPNFERLGFGPGYLVVCVLIAVEFFGGISVALGLFTRFFAAAAAIEMGVIVVTQYLPNGFSWLNRGYEYVLLLGLINLAIWWRGGGPYSLDRRLGVEL